MGPRVVRTPVSGPTRPNCELSAGRSYYKERGEEPRPSPTSLRPWRAGGSFVVRQDRCDPPSSTLPQHPQRQAPLSLVRPCKGKQNLTA